MVKTVNWARLVNLANDVVALDIVPENALLPYVMWKEKAKSVEGTKAERWQCPGKGKGTGKGEGKAGPSGLPSCGQLPEVEDVFDRTRRRKRVP